MWCKSFFPESPSPTSTAATGGGPPFLNPSSGQQEQQQEQKHEQQQRADLDAEATSLLTSARDAPEGSFEDGGVAYTMRPIYPLASRPERDDWPVLGSARESPIMLTPFSYNAAMAWAALTTSLSLLSAEFVASQALTFSVINSHSMEPTLQVRGRGWVFRCGGVGFWGEGDTAAVVVCFRVVGWKRDLRLVKDVWITLVVTLLFSVHINEVH